VFGSFVEEPEKFFAVPVEVGCQEESHVGNM